MNETVVVPVAIIRQWMAFINDNLPCKYGNPLLAEMNALLQPKTTPAQPTPVAAGTNDTAQ